MSNPEKYQVNYWAGGENYDYQAPKKRSIKKKISIVLSFIFVLAVTPSLIYTLMNLDFNNGREVSVVTSNIQTPIEPKATEPEVHKVFIEEPKSTENEATVINNDSYWKITKRVCGKGNNYLLIKEQNNGKALYKGDTVTVNCEI